MKHTLIALLVGLIAAAGASSAAADTSGKKIALSNNYAGNSWRQAMLRSWEKVTGQAVSDGVVAAAGVMLTPEDEARWAPAACLAEAACLPLEPPLPPAVLILTLPGVAGVDDADEARCSMERLLGSFLPPGKVPLLLAVGVFLPAPVLSAEAWRDACCLVAAFPCDCCCCSCC